MRGTVERRTTTALIKEERSSINQQTVRTCERGYQAVSVCVFARSSGCRAVVCSS